MLLFKHKQHMQSCNTQSSKQRKIFAFKEKDYNTRLVELQELDISNPKMYIKPAPGNTVHVEKRKSCCVRVHL